MVVGIGCMNEVGGLGGRVGVGQVEVVLEWKASLICVRRSTFSNYAMVAQTVAGRQAESIKVGVLFRTFDKKVFIK